MNRYSGKFVLRIPLDMHKQLSESAKAKKVSLNQACVALLAIGLAKNKGEPAFMKPLNDVSLQLEEHFGSKLCGVVLFGSYATGNATSASDIDLLVVLKKDVPIERGLYKWWDENVFWKEDAILNPHFVSLPDDAENAGGLWLEVATQGNIIYEKAQMISGLFGKLRALIDNGRVRQYSSNGHSYWVWR